VACGGGHFVCDTQERRLVCCHRPSVFLFLHGGHQALRFLSRCSLFLSPLFFVFLPCLDILLRSSLGLSRRSSQGGVTILLGWHQWLSGGQVYRVDKVQGCCGSASMVTRKRKSWVSHFRLFYHVWCYFSIEMTTSAMHVPEVSPPSHRTVRDKSAQD